MIDLHCHILPNLDDGAKNVEEALEMAKIAVEDGIEEIVATPHTHDGFYINSRSEVLSAVEQFQQILDANGIQLRIHPGNEVHVHLDLISNVVSFESLTICNNGKYLLLELPVQSIPIYTEELLYELSIEGITPIIAHPERNVELRENPNRLAEWIMQGAIAQLTAGSLLGYMGERAKETAEYMVRNNLVHILASDAHNTARRRPELSKAFHALTKLTSKEEEMYYRLNSRAILHGETFRKKEPILLRKKKKRWIFF